MKPQYVHGIYRFGKDILVLLALFSCLPIFFLYAFLCFTIPFIRLGKTRRGGSVRCYIKKDSIHSDYVFDSCLWSDLFPELGRFIIVGWGDRKIFLETKAWRDLKAVDFLKAFFGLNPSVLKIDFADKLDEMSFVDMNEDQFKILKRHVAESTNFVEIKKTPEYFQEGIFYESHLRYNCLTNCNNWVGRGFRKAGLYGGFWFPLTIWIR